MPVPESHSGLDLEANDESKLVIHLITLNISKKFTEILLIKNEIKILNAN